MKSRREKKLKVCRSAAQHQKALLAVAVLLAALLSGLASKL